MGCLILLYQGKGRAHMGPGPLLWAGPMGQAHAWAWARPMGRAHGPGPGPYDQDRTRLMVSAPGHWEAINLVTRLICPPGSSINLVLGPGLRGCGILQ